MDQPPSTTNPTRTARRVLLTTVATLAVMAGSAGIAAASAGTSPLASRTTAARAQQGRVHTETVSEPVRFTPTAPAGIDANPVVARLEALFPPTGAVVLPSLPPELAPTTTTTAAPAPVAAAPRVQAVQAAAAAPATRKTGADPSDPAVWDRLAKCEAGGNWAANTHNGYYGGLQFSAASWHSVGGTGLPNQNTREVQIEMGQRLQARSGWSQWPACTRKLGYR